MSLQDELMDDLKEALRDKDEVRKGTIRVLLAALKNARVAKNADLDDDEQIAVLTREVKQRRDALAEFEKAGREDLVTSEVAALEVLQDYMPQMLSEDEIADLAREAIVEVGATGPAQTGEVMRVVMGRVKGRAEGREVSRIVRGLLAELHG